MKKKRLYLVTIIALLAILFGGSGGVAWGQAYRKGYVTAAKRAQLRRTNNIPGIDSIRVSGNVGGELGAGESVKIVNNNGNEQNNLNWKDATSLHFGSDTSKNIVIRSYTGGGFAMGWISFALDMSHSGNDRVTSHPVTPTDSTGEGYNNNSLYAYGKNQNAAYFIGLEKFPGCRWMPNFPQWMKDAYNLVKDDYNHGFTTNNSQGVWGLVRTNIPTLSDYYDRPVGIAMNSGKRVFSFSRYTKDKFEVSTNNPNPWNANWNGEDPKGSPTPFGPPGGTADIHQKMVGTSGTSGDWNNKSGFTSGMPTNAEAFVGCCKSSLFEMKWTNGAGNTTGGTVDAWHHNGHHDINPAVQYYDGIKGMDVGPLPQPNPKMYTTTKDQQTHRIKWPEDTYLVGNSLELTFESDDSIPLVQINGTMMTSGGDMSAQTPLLSPEATKAKQDNSDHAVYQLLKLGGPSNEIKTWPNNATTVKSLANYKRPTTAIINGNSSHTFTDITFKEINWWYARDTIWTRVKKISMFGCCQGAVLGMGVNPEWCPTPTMMGRTHLDAAAVLESGANVCVQNDIADKTTTAASKRDAAFGAFADSITDALVVLPGNDRFTLRVGGNFDSINMVHDHLPANEFYKQSNFPVAADSVYSYPNNVSFGSGFQFAPASLKDFNNGGSINLPALATETPASVLGVHKNYNYKANTAPVGNGGKNAEWTTHTPINPADHPGVIEIGDTTKGTGHMHIYSGGMLKNFGGCMVNSSFQMYLGCPVPGYGDKTSAQFNLNGNQPLYITNYGVGTPTSPCNADLLFYKAATDSLATAFKNASGNGMMRIQAYNDVELRADATIDATPRGNDFYMLSDGGNVITQKFNFTSKYNTAPTARGLLGIWAEDRDPSLFVVCPNTGLGNRNSARGNVYMNDSVKITRPTSTNGAETNVRAANNIRTAMFDYTSDNDKNDITNVISRKGDVYLGYSIKARRFDDNGTQGNTSYEFNNNIFRYNVTNTDNAGSLNIKSGWDDNVDNGEQMDGGNIYFVGIKANMVTNGTYPTNINIPFSNEYLCGSTKTTPATGLLHERKKDAMRRYEHAGIIGGVGHCGEEQFDGWSNYGGLLLDNETPGHKYTDTSLVYNGNKGDLTVDAGKRGNIIMNRGVMLNYNDDNGNATFRTRDGDIDMRDPFDAKKMKGGLLFLAQLENLSDLAKIGVCGCDEERNNVYLQDFEYTAKKNSGSVFVGADNNIKLNYGGLTNIGTRQDPFLSKPVRDNGTVYKEGFGYAGAANRGCAKMYHCDLDGNENQARTLLLNFSDSVTSGGFAAVASDMIDVYKDLKYYGGKGSGLSAVPGTGTLHGENVAGYGLFMKTQGNKANWTDNILLQAPKCPTTCLATGCDNVKAGQKPRAFLHNTVRMTFHGDARFYAENQRVHLESPVIETFGVLELNAKDKAGSNAMITIKTDSLICHDSLIRKGTGKVQFSTWSGLPKDLPIIKLGYSRRAAPFAEYSYDDGNTRKLCRKCVDHYKGKVYPPDETPLDTIFVKFGPDTEWERQNVMVIDHTVITFLTDSFDHVKGGGVLNARYFVDTTKIRNQVEFWTDKNHERDGHLELISERQMGSKDYAGLYTKHLHLEPIGACGHPTSEMWLPGPALDVITTSTFGGFGIQYTDVHVENGANLNPGFTSLRLRGQCYEQACGTLTMKDLRLDGGAELHFSVGTTRGLNGEFSDAIDVDKLTTYGPVNVNIEIRPCEEIEKRCYPLIYYKSVSPNSLNTLKLHPATVKIDGEEYPLSLNIGTDGIVYLCVGNATTPTPVHTITMPETPGVKTTPGKGIWKTPARSSFPFKAVYTGTKPLVVRTNRMVNGVQEVLGGVKNANGEYEYIIPHVQQEITLTFGPDVVSNEFLAGAAVWSHGEMIYIRVERADIASIYSVAGQLVKRVDLPEGDTSIPMSRGAYVITLKDGSVYKVIVK